MLLNQRQIVKLVNLKVIIKFLDLMVVLHIKHYYGTIILLPV